MKKFWAVFVARNLEFFRDRSTLIFNLAFPIILILGFAYAFPSGGGTTFKVGVVGGMPAAGSAEDIPFLHFQHLQFLPYAGLATPLDRLAHDQIDMVIDFSKKEYYVNEASSNGYVLEKMFAAGDSSGGSFTAGAGSTGVFSQKTVSGTPIRYVDWLVPGVLGINILLGSLSGVGFVIVRYRRNGVLKRFKATPLSAFQFVSAQVLSRFFIVAFLSTVIFAGTDSVLHFRMAGSWALLALVNALAILCMISLGLVFSSRIKSEEAAGGIMNLITWPMMILSGVFFSLEGTPHAMQLASRAFPITYYIEASRAIMLDGAGLAKIAGDLGVLAAMTLAFLAAAAALFKWE
ncbi:MAG TPA: ABC transporter permease [Rectinemataceae bacterium]|nr:ABC transporter permease [Rectinemataceae bacterium]